MSFLKSIFGKGSEGKQPEVSVEEKKMLLEKIRQAELFKKLPAKNLEDMFVHMESIGVKEGSSIIKEGEEGDYYYLLVKGNAKVFRRLAEGQAPSVVAELTEPQGFGEEALISNAKRNATITMITDGMVMRLSKDAFNDFVKEPLLDWYTPAQAQDKIANGAKWIDVRSESLSKHSHLHGAISIPVEEIRTKASTLSKDITYICYCENGRISSSAAFILKQMGYNAGVLRGGLQSLKRAGQN